jgi:3-deoxy-D-manno-octulosonate 8-phosphate phosphatase (KDO 8-P phosphatase)
MAQIETLYTQVSQAWLNKLKEIKLLVCDVDGVFSDGRIYLGNHGEELKAFHTRDGYGVKALIKQGIDIAIITGRQSQIVASRMQSLTVQHIIQGEEDKATAMANLMQQLALQPHEVAAIGDDMPDTGMYNHCHTRIAVADAHPLVKQQANWITTLPGGFGAIREVADTLLQAHNKLHGIHGASI